MKLVCDGLDLADAVLKVIKATATKTTNPILEGIKLVAENECLRLSATDLELMIETTIKADVKMEGTVVVPGKFFSEYVRKLTNEQITLETNENNQLNINDIKRLIRDNRKNIDYKIRDSESKTLLMYAVFNGDTEIINDIAKYGNQLNEIDNDGRTALHWAVYYNKYDAVVALIELGAKDYIKDNYSLTPIDIAQYEGYEEIYKYLSSLQ